jgi:hypothetical protein
MATKKTIAIIGATEKNGRQITSQFAQKDYRLLLISNDTDQLSVLSKSLTTTQLIAEIEPIACVKDGCWEADIIILAVPLCDEKEAAERMREVATQKIVALVSENEAELKTLQQLLPHSKLVKISGDFPSKEISIVGNNQEAKEEISDIFQNAGYKITIKQQS